MRTARAELIAVSIGVLLLVAAFVVPLLDLGIVAPLINSTERRIRMFAYTAPLFGWWDAHVGPGTIPAILIGIATALWGPTVARILPWRAVPLVTWATAMAWAFSLAMVDGWGKGFTGRLIAPHEYLREVPEIDDIGNTLRSFSDRILDHQPDSWITHVSGHPPGALLSFVWLDRIGLGGGAWAALLCLLVGSSAAAAVVITVRAVGDETLARAAAPFVAVAPTAIWIAVSADGYFAGVAAWGIALLAIAVHGVSWRVYIAAVGAGLLLGWALFLNYGLSLIALLAFAVLATATGYASGLGAALPTVATVLGVVVVFVAFGFWWFDGYLLVQERYWDGIAKDRPFQYWGWANFASVVCAIGLGNVAGLGRLFDISAIRRRSGLHLLLIGALTAIVLADLSMLSKAETERIWLPFTIWLTAAGALLPARSHRLWLAVNVIGALVINHTIFTNW
ncbi:MAG: hypothetical protein ACSLE6_09740 [Mycobacterium sp.]